MTTIENPYLQQGNFAPVAEEVTAFDLPVTGSLPPELDGRLLRNGPNPIGAEDPATYHWFTGEGMVHGVRLRDGRAEWYRNRWVRSPDVAAALGEPVPPSPYGPDVRIFAANTNVQSIGGRTYALVEAGAPPIELTDDLDTVGPSDFAGTLEHPFSAHPKLDPATGDWHVAAYFWGWGNEVRYLRIGADGTVARSVSVPTPGSPMVHDIAFTETYALLLDLPCTFDLDAAMGGARLPYLWNEGYGARIGLLPLDGADDGSDVRWVDIDPCYIFHPLNAYDLPDGRVVLDAVRHPKVFDRQRLGPDEGPPRLDRWTIDPTAGTAAQETLDDRPQEFPRLNEAFQGRAHRYGYGVTTEASLAPTTALKHDVVAGSTEVHDFGPGRTSLEPVFVAREGATAEDDGWILAHVHDAGTDRSDVVVLDAQDFTGEPVATVHLPVRVPYGFHGNWVPSRP
jgi:carotenoid cleavage dioxygenase-like enzyme